ncbi:MAG: hypothetical protein II200_03820 [Bacteroidaceae bacterium]|nr:hypothetical protein [Bacteroidaceae bacterium]
MERTISRTLAPWMLMASEGSLEFVALTDSAIFRTNSVTSSDHLSKYHPCSTE